MQIKFVNQPLFQEYYFNTNVDLGPTETMYSSTTSIMSRTFQTEEYRITNSGGGILTWLQSLPQDCTVYIYDIRSQTVHLANTMGRDEHEIYHLVRAYIDTDQQNRTIAPDAPRGWYASSVGEVKKPIDESEMKTLSVRGLKNIRNKN